MLNIDKRIDAHIHFAHPLTPDALITFMGKTGIEAADPDTSVAKDAMAFFNKKR